MLLSLQIMDNMIEKEHPILNPRHHIANPLLLQQFECSICYQLHHQVMKCKGPCGKPFCPKCICRIKIKKDQCPNKCSQPFHTVSLEGQVHVQFQCPFKPDICDIPLTSIQEFRKHCEICPFVTFQGFQQMENKKDFKCSKGHKLDLITPELLKSFPLKDDFYTIVMNEICADCSSRNLCRAICLECSTFEKRQVYCIECRKYPFKKQKCSEGHIYEQIGIKNEFIWVCDQCGKAGAIASQKGFFDIHCNMFICSVCYETLPENEEKEVKINI